jgi:hypothetical protein
LTRKSFLPFSQEAACRQGGTVNGKSIWRVTTDARERWRIIKLVGQEDLNQQPNRYQRHNVDQVRSYTWFTFDFNRFCFGLFRLFLVRSQNVQGFEIVHEIIALFENTSAA